jgi:5'-3' exonuclease
VNKPQIVLIDFSSIAHPVWHMASNDPNPDATSIGIIAKVRALASGQPHVALCLDSPKSFRKEMDATYKAARESKPAPFFHQCEIALETLKTDGYPQWMAEGFEADDVIASATAQARVGAWPVLVVSADKDLLQLVTEHVSVKSPVTGNVMDPTAVKEKFGVTPDQIRDYLTLVGDASDGVVGVRGIGAKGAAALLATFGNLDDLYTVLHSGVELNAVKPAQRAALEAFRDRLPTVRALLSLREDAPIEFVQVLKERQTTDSEVCEECDGSGTVLDAPADVLNGHPYWIPCPSCSEDLIMTDINEAMPTVEQELTADQATDALGAFVADVARRVAPKAPTPQPEPDVSPAPAPRLSLAPVTADYERQLEPQSMNQAVQLAQLLFKARLFSAYGTPEAVLSTVLSGRELGLSAMASLRAFHVVEGKPTMAADALRALVLKSGKAKTFRCTERTAQAATFTTTREGEEPMELRYTIEEAQAAGLVKNGGSWTKNPADMLVARASSKLARLVYPDVVAGLYAPEELS